MNSREVIARHPDLLSYGQFNRWCNIGVFGESVSNPGRGRSRDFSEEDLRVAVTLAHVTTFLDHMALKRSEFLIFLANLIRDGGKEFEFDATGVKLTIDLQRQTP